MERVTYGTYLDWLREKRTDKLMPSNPYIHKAADMRDMVYTGKEIRNAGGKIFQDDKKLIVEIGCYKGETIKELAYHNSETNFVGIDIKYKRVVKTSLRLIEENLKNAVTVIADAKEFFESVEPSSVHGVAVFFPDPWIKDSQKKKRLLNREFIELVKEKLVSGGFIWFKTDNLEYFEETEDLMKDTGFSTEAKAIELPVLPDHETFFEQMFREQGVNNNELVVYS